MNVEDMTIQDLQLELMRRATFNDYNGERVVKDLKEHKDLWEGVIMDRETVIGIPGRELSSTTINLIKLRDIGDNRWNVDTVFILPHLGKEDELYKLAKQWRADEVGWVGSQEALRMLGGSLKTMDPKRALLSLWWD